MPEGKSHEKKSYAVDKKKLEELKKKAKGGRKGAKGSIRRVQKVTKGKSAEDPKLHNALKKLNATPIPNVTEVNFFMEDNSILQFDKPKVNAAVQANTFVVMGEPQTKSIQDILPSLLQQFQPKDLESLKKLADQIKLPAADKSTEETEQSKDDDVPEVESFEQSS